MKNLAAICLPLTKFFAMAALLLVAPTTLAQTELNPVAPQIFALSQLNLESNDRQQANVEASIVADPAGHSCCVTEPPILIEVYVVDGNLILQPFPDESAVPWWTFDPIPIDENLDFMGESNATVAGVNNIRSVISGTISEDRITAEVVIGSSGGLPQDQAITYNLAISPAGIKTWFFAEMDGPLLPLQVAAHKGINVVERGINADDTIDLAISIDADGKNSHADWWILLVEGEDIFYFNFAFGKFLPGVQPSFEGPLGDVLNPHPLLLNFQPPSNDFTIFWAIDEASNGVVDLFSLTSLAFTTISRHSF